MARIPVYQERQQASGLMRVPELRVPDAGGQAMGRAAQQVGQALSNVAETAETIYQDNSKAAAVKKLGQAKKDQMQYFLRSQNEAQPGAAGFTGSYDKQFQDYSNQLLEQESDPAVRRYLSNGLLQLKDTMTAKALSFEAQESYVYKVDQVNAGISDTALAIAADPFDKQLYETSRGEMNAMIDSMQLPPSQKAKMKRAIDDTFSQAAWEGQLVKDPEAVLRTIGDAAGGGSFDNAVGFVLKEEGSELVLDDAGAGKTKHGINETANPDVDVEGLDEKGARQIYLERYWNQIGGDSLPPGLAMVALDSAVLMGQVPATKLLKQSGGDIDRFIELRKIELERIAQIPGKEKYKKGWMARTDRVQRAAKSVSIEDPQPTLSATGNFAFDNLPLDAKIRAASQAKTLAKQQQATRKAELKARLQDVNAMALDGTADPNPISKDQFVLAFGAEEGLNQYTNYQQNQKLASNIASLKTLPSDEINQLLRSAEPQEGEGYAAQSQRFGALAKAAQQVIKLRDADPVRYVTENSPNVQKASQTVEDVNTNPDATVQERQMAYRNLINTSLAEQERLGVVKPKLLSEPEAQAFEQRMLTADEPAADFVAGLEQTYGKGDNGYFGDVMQELVARGNVPPVMMIIPDLESPAARQVVSGLANVSMDELKAGVNALDVRDVKEQVSEVIGQLRVTLGPQSPEMVTQLSGYNDMMVKIAVDSLGRGAHESASSAVDSARNLLLGQYEFQGTLRLPKTVDPSAVTIGLSNYLDLELLPNIDASDVPVDLTNARTPEEAIEYWQEQVEDKHFWLSDNETKGAYLWAEGDNGVFYPVNQGGEQVFMPFDSATEMADDTRTFRGRLRRSGLM